MVVVNGRCACPANTGQFQADISNPTCRCPGNQIKNAETGNCECPAFYPLWDGQNCGCPTDVELDSSNWENPVIGTYFKSAEMLNSQSVYGRRTDEDMTLFYNGNRWQIANDNIYKVLMNGGSDNIVITADDPALLDESDPQAGTADPSNLWKTGWKKVSHFHYEDKGAPMYCMGETAPENLITCPGIQELDDDDMCVCPEGYNKVGDDCIPKRALPLRPAHYKDGTIPGPDGSNGGGDDTMEGVPVGVDNIKRKTSVQLFSVSPLDRLLN